MPKLAKIYRERLQALAKYMATKVPLNQFKYTQWAGREWDGDPELSCGTKACVLGWGTTMPMLRGLGLYLTRSRWERAVVVALRLPGGKSLIPERSSIDDPILGRILKRVFGLELGQIEHLFSPGWNEEDATPNEVAAKIRRWLKSH